MRYQTWGISRTRLFAFALIPAFAWALFRVQSLPELSLSAVFLYYRMALWVWGSILLFLTILWIYFFRRGIFQARVLGYVFMTAELFFELYQSVQARDLLHLTSALAYFGVVIVSYRWLEGWVELAAFNPKMRWFEGRPKMIPHLSVRVRSTTSKTDEPESQWFDASVRRLDQKGLFIVLDQPVADSAQWSVHQKLEFQLKWKQKEVLGEGKVVGKLLEDNAPQQVSGMGLLISVKGLYHFTQYTALYQALKGEGYAF